MNFEECKELARKNLIFIKRYDVLNDEHQFYDVVNDLYNAMKKYDPSKAKVSTYAKKCVENYVYLFRHNKPQLKMVNYVPPVEYKGNELSNFEARDLIYNCKSLNEREQSIVYDRIFQDNTFKEIGEKHHLSKERVRRQYNDAIEKLRLECVKP